MTKEQTTALIDFLPTFDYNLDLMSLGAGEVIIAKIVMSKRVKYIFCLMAHIVNLMTKWLCCL